MDGRTDTTKCIFSLLKGTITIVLSNGIENIKSKPGETIEMCEMNEAKYS